MVLLTRKHLNPQNVALGFAIITAVVIAWPAVLQFDKISVFGLLILPFILRVNKKQKQGYRFWILALIFALLNFSFGQPYWAFASAISLLFGAIEWRVGRLNSMALYSLIFYLPLTRSFFTLFGFYIRLEITKWAAHLVGWIQSGASYQQTQVFYNNQQFSVDAGCMGLRLVITGFLLTLLILNQVAIRQGIKLKTKVVSLFLGLSFVLVVVANFFRIVFLIVLQSPEGTLSHEGIGVISLLVFHLIPMVILIRLVLKKQWVIQQDSSVLNIENRANKPWVVWGLLPAILLVLLLPNELHSRKQANTNFVFEGYKSVPNIDGVTTYVKGESQFTVKPMHPLSFSNHHPMLCWRGDGFEISNEASGNIGEIACMQANLKSPTQNDLKTVWWYSNGSNYSTLNEMEWRLRALFKGERFYIMNFTSSNPNELVYMVNQVLPQIESQNNS